MEAYTNAPSSLDYAGYKVAGDFGLGLLRVVSGGQTVRGTTTIPQGLALKPTVI